MAGRETYDSVIKYNRAVLFLIGCWPDENNEYNTFSKIRFVLSAFLIFHGGTLPQMGDLFFVSRDRDSIIQNLSNSNFAMMNTLIKILVWWYTKADIYPIIKCIRDDWQNPKTDTEYREMLDVAKLGRKIAKFLIVMGQGNVMLRCMLNIFMHVTGLFPTRTSYFPRSWFFYNSTKTPVDQITWLTQFIGGITSANTYIAVDGFIGFSVLHICGQMAILKNELRVLTEPIKNEEENALDLIKKKLSFITQRHAYLISLVQKKQCTNVASALYTLQLFFFKLVDAIENNFNMMFLFQMLSLTVQICFQGFLGLKALTAEEGASFFEVFFMCYFILICVLLFFLYCYVDEQLTVQTEGIRNAVFECGWHLLPAAEVKSLAFIVLRTQSAPCITAGKFCTFTMVTFGEVIKRSVGYLSVLLTIREF